MGVGSVVHMIATVQHCGMLNLSTMLAVRHIQTCVSFYIYIYIYTLIFCGVCMYISIYIYMYVELHIHVYVEILADGN